ncbi:MAG: segregation/condensation protein A [Armatimonadetes bacterium]|nr:MAG: segregation/condensation protein A [Armatimonadota bacterium]
MSFQVKTRVFEGPLDLLLQLITSHQLAITELSLVGIVNEYVAFVDQMQELDLEVASEFLLIASTLIQIKARHLLPDDEPFDLDEELALAEERDRLLARLLAALTFKDVAAVIRYRIEVSEHFLSRSAGLEGIGAGLTPEVIIPTDVAGFAVIAERVFTTPILDPDVDHLDLDLPSVQDAMVDLQGRMASIVTADFDEVVAHCTRDAEVVAYFLALLELARWGIVRVSQEESSPIIDIRYDKVAAERRFNAVIGMEEAS